MSRKPGIGGPSSARTGSPFRLLTAGIAHDLNNLLLIAVGHVSLMGSGRGGEAPGDGALETVRLALQKAVGLVTHLQVVANLGQRPDGPASVRDVLRDVARLAVSEHRILCSCESFDGLWPVAMSDAELCQVVLNLVTNAEQAMHGGGTVRILAESRRLMAPAEVGEQVIGPGCFVRLCVRDDGAGISEDRIPGLFRSFQTTRPGGHGVGLASSATIIEQHGGAIAVRSKVGVGSEFEVWLKARDPDATDSL